MFKLILIMLMLSSMLCASAIATILGTGDANGYKDTHVLVPVDITDVQNGSIPAIVFNVLYDNNVLTVTDIHNGLPTTNWDEPTYCNYVWGTRVALVYDAHRKQPIQNGATSLVAQLNCSVIGESGDTSELNFTDIQLAENYQITRAIAKNGTFTVLSYGTINGRATDITGTEMPGVVVTRTVKDFDIVFGVTTTNETGYFEFTTIEATEYHIKTSKLRYWEVTTLVSIQSGETKTVNIVLLRKGDFNNNGISADAGDVTMMLRAAVNKLTPDWRFDLNNNGVLADASDITMICRAAVHKLELL